VLSLSGIIEAPIDHPYPDLDLNQGLNFEEFLQSAYTTDNKADDWIPHHITVDETGCLSQSSPSASNHLLDRRQHDVRIAEPIPRLWNRVLSHGTSCTPPSHSTRH